MECEDLDSQDKRQRLGEAMGNREKTHAELSAELDKERAGRQEAEHLVRTLLEAYGEMALLLEVDGTIVEASPAAAQNVRMEAEAMRGRDVYGFQPPILAASDKERIAQAVRDNKQVVFRDGADSGLEYEVTVLPVPDRNGDAMRVAVCFRDLTESIRARKALEESEERFRAFFEKSPIGLFVATTVQPVRFIVVNESLSRWNGISVRNHIGLELGEVFDPGVGAKAGELLHTGRPAALETEGTNVHGKRVRLAVRLFPLKGQDGAVSAIGGSVEGLS